MTKAARAIADLSTGLILATVDIAVHPERVFRALASEDIVRWWGSADTYRTTKWMGDVKVGGAWRSDGMGADGSAFHVGGEFLEIDPPNKLVHTWVAPWDGNAVTTVTYRLDAVDGGTRVTIKHEGFANRGESCANHTAGWERVLGWLSAYLR